MRSACVFILLGCFAASASAQTPLEVLQRQFGSLTDAGDPLAFPMKIRSIGSSDSTFWRGTKDLYFNWCAANCKDWLADGSWQVISQGDLHFGNVGTYASRQHFGATAFGLVDFDESCRIPLPVEMLEAVITVQLTAEQHHLADATADRAARLAAIIAGYRDGLLHGRAAVDRLSDEPIVADLLAHDKNQSIDDDVQKFAQAGHFRPAIWNAKGTKLKDILRPAGEESDAIAGALSDAMKRSPAVAALFRVSTPEDIRSSILDVARRTHLDSSGSQGLEKLLVLMRRPLRGADGDAIIYFKQEIPSAAERAAAEPLDRRPPGERASDDCEALCDPPVLLNTWGDANGKSFWITLKDPWNEELSPDPFDNEPEMLNGARLLGIAAGASHARDAKAAELAARLDAGLTSKLQMQADAYLQQLRLDRDSFTRDPRVAQMKTEADAAITAAGSAGR